METAYSKYFEKNMEIVDNALRSLDLEKFEALADECVNALKNGYKVIASGLGKNVPICEKFVGTMISLGFDASFLHTNSAVHGDMGMVKPGDIVILLTKSGATSESIYFFDMLCEQKSNAELWLLSYKDNSPIADKIKKKIIIDLEHEGDMWDVVPNNSTVLNLIILQELAIELSRRFKLDLKKDFKPNHPGGAIGASLRDEREK